MSGYESGEMGQGKKGGCCGCCCRSRCSWGCGCFRLLMVIVVAAIVSAATTYYMVEPESIRIDVFETSPKKGKN